MVAIAKNISTVEYVAGQGLEGGIQEKEEVMSTISLLWSYLHEVGWPGGRSVLILLFFETKCQLKSKPTALSWTSNSVGKGEKNWNLQSQVLFEAEAHSCTLPSPCRSERPQEM